jgi:hypothetical protein
MIHFMDADQLRECFHRFQQHSFAAVADQTLFENIESQPKGNAQEIESIDPRIFTDPGHFTDQQAGGIAANVDGRQDHLFGFCT